MRAESQPVPPKISAPPSLTAFAAIVLGATALGAGAVVFFFNPSTHGFYPVCLFHKLTGWNCPGCGGTRAAYALLHGQYCARAEGQRAVCCCARGGGRARQSGSRQSNSGGSRSGSFCRRSFCGFGSPLPRFSRCCGICRRLRFSRLEQAPGRLWDTSCGRTGRSLDEKRAGQRQND